MFETEVAKKIRTHIMFYSSPHPHPPEKNHAVYEKKCKDLVQPDRPQMTI
jgi:hypothetical protein